MIFIVTSLPPLASEVVLMVGKQPLYVSNDGVDYVFMCCHTFAMTSTITNPILYGWLNTNLKHLFR